MSYFIEGSKGLWEYVIGLEVHAQISSKSKLFSGSATSFGASPNSQTSLVDSAMPGALPVLNEKCVELAVRTGLALNARINRRSVFDRKNYFYPDLPAGYQISQFYFPIVQEGYVEIALENGKVKKIGINRLHLENDAGKSLHDQSDEHSFIDLNRCGVGLMEIVSDPDLSSPEEAAEYLKKLRSILRYVKTCDGDMEKGSLRCDANVSVRPAGSINLGTRVEIKNVNSIKNVAKAIEHEGTRQVAILEEGGKIIQETRLFDADSGKTRSMRLKEESQDYRYFPDPDLLPLVISKEFIEKIRESLPELPEAKVKRYTEKLGLGEYEAKVLAADETVALYFEKAAESADPKEVANWVTGELFSYLNKNSVEIGECKISPESLGEIVALIEKGVISGKIAKRIIEIAFETGEKPTSIIEKEGLTQISDETSLIKIVEEVLAENSSSVTEYKQGKEKLFGFFVGKAMQKSKGKANPEILNKLLAEKLNS